MATLARSQPDHELGEIWLVFYKQGTKKPTLNYEESVEEALC